MALIAPPDRVLETSTTTGTGTYTLAGAVTGFRAASAACANGDTGYYYAEDVDASGVPLGGWETGIGTWATGGTLARTTIHASSNAGAAVNWSAGTRRISLSLTAAAVAAPIASRSALAITKTGNWLYPLALPLIPPKNIDIAGTVTAAPGKWTETVSYTEASATISPRLLTVSFDDLAGSGNLVFNSCTVLTSISFPVLVMAGVLQMITLPALTTLSLPALVYCGSGAFVQSLAALTTLSLPALVYCGSNFTLSTMAALTTLTVTALVTVVGSCNPNTMGALTTLAMAALTNVGGSYNPNTMASLTTMTITNLAIVGTSFNPSTMAALTTISAPALTSVGTTINPSSMAALTTLTFGALIDCGTGVTLTSGTGALTSLTLGTTSTLKFMGGNVNVTSAALTQGSVDGVLAVLANLDGTNGTTAFSTPRTVTLTGTSATPSAAGLVSKATLVARGVTVTHN